MKLIIDIPDKVYEGVKALIAINFGGRFSGKGLAHDSLRAIKNGVPLDDVKAEIHEKVADYVARGYADSAEDFEEYSRIVNQTFDNIGKGES